MPAIESKQVFKDLVLVTAIAFWETVIWHFTITVMVRHWHWSCIIYIAEDLKCSQQSNSEFCIYLTRTNFSFQIRALKETWSKCHYFRYTTISKKCM